MKKTTVLFLSFITFSTTVLSQSNTNMPRFTAKNWTFNYVNSNKKVVSLTGEVNLKVTNGSDMSVNNAVKISYSFGGKNYSGNYIVSSYKHVKNYHFWSLRLKSSSKNAKVNISLYDQKQYVKAKDLYLKGLLMIINNGKNSSFYLE